MRRRTQIVFGLTIIALLIVVVVLPFAFYDVAKQNHVTSSPTIYAPLTISPPTYLRIVFDVVDELTNQPVTGEITIRRERISDGSQVEAEKFFTGQHLEIETPIDPNVRLYVLVEATGYHDWEVGMRINKGGTLTAPIRLKPIATPRPQG